jgi:hypothetical protein
MIRSLIPCALFAGLGTALVVGALLVVLPSLRIASGAAVTDSSMVVRAVLIEGRPGGQAVLAAPEAWRSCPHLGAIAARSRCPYLAAIAGGSGCPYLRGTAGHRTCPFLGNWPGRDSHRIPRDGDPTHERPRGGAALARLDPAPLGERTGGRI